MIDVLRIAHLRIAPQEGNLEVGNCEGNRIIEAGCCVGDKKRQSKGGGKRNEKERKHHHCFGFSFWLLLLGSVGVVNSIQSSVGMIYLHRQDVPEEERRKITTEVFNGIKD